MSPNGKYGDGQIRQLEKALKGATTGNDLLDDMAATVPQADSAFEKQLEDMLIAQLEHTQHGGSHNMQADRPMTQFPTPRRQQQHQTTRIPLTLVAAVLLMIVAGSILIVANQLPPEPTNDNFAASGLEQNEPTSVPTIGPDVTLVPDCQIITVNEANLYDDVNENSAVLTTLDADVTLTVNQTLDLTATEGLDWYHVLIGEGEDFMTGWVTVDSINEVTQCEGVSRLLPDTTSALSNGPTAVPPASGTPIPTLVPGECVVYQGPDATFYAVKEGDTLSGIAEQFNVDPIKLMEANCFHTQSTVMLNIGQEIVIPPNTMSVLEPTIVPSVLATATPIPRVEVSTPILPTVVPPDSAISPYTQNLQPVIVAAVDIHRATQITEDMLMVVYYPEEDTATGTFNSIELVSGQYTLEAIKAGQPVVADDVINSPFLNATGSNGSVIPNNKVAIALPVEKGLTQEFTAGDRLAIVAALIFVDVDNTDLNFQQVEPPDELDSNGPISIPEGGGITLQTVVKDADFLIMGDSSELSDQSYPVDPEMPQNVIIIAVTPQEAEVLTWLIESKVPYTVIKTG